MKVGASSDRIVSTERWITACAGMAIEGVAMSLSGKVVLVTGAQQGIGRAMALEFAAAGADVAVNWLDDETAAQGVADRVRARGRREILVRADVGQIQQVQAMVAAVQDGLGPIDVLIN